jgi:hypothetical protein
MSAPCPTFGFTVFVSPHDDVSPSERAAMIAELEAIVEANDLCASRRGTRTTELVIRREGSQATDADRAIVHAWAERWTGRAEIAVSELADLSAVD